MNWFILLVVAATELLLIHHVVVRRKTGFWTADSLFVISCWVMLVGTLALPAVSAEVGSRYALVMFIPLVAYTSASIVVFAVRSLRAPEARYRFERVVVYKPGSWFWFTLVVSAIIVILYFMSVGYNLFLDSITGNAAADSAEFSQKRLAAYSGDRYLFPGYVNQFKNVLLPALATVAATYLLGSKIKGRLPYTIALGAGAVLSLLGTGQRGAFSLFAFTLCGYLWLVSPVRRWRRFGLVAMVGFPLFTLATVFQMRNEALADDTAGFGVRLTSALGEVSKRIFVDNQASGWAGFQFTRGLPTQWGGEWLDGILGILPTNSGSDLSAQIAKSLWGSDAGTAPVSMWGSVHYNWDWLGLFVFPVLLAVAYHWIGATALSAETPSTLELMGMVGTFVSLGFWIAGGPDTVLNGGGLTYALLWIVARRSRISTAMSRDESLSPVALDRVP